MVALCLNIICSKHSAPLSDSDKPLSPDAVGRGPYVNSGECFSNHLQSHANKDADDKHIPRLILTRSNWTGERSRHIIRLL
jgi:hypothetical protein